MKLFFIELEKVAKEAYRILKIDKYIAWLIGDHWRKKSGFIPVGLNIYNILSKYFQPVDIIVVARHNQTSNTPFWIDKAIKYNFYLRGFKYLIIMKKVS